MAKMINVRLDEQTLHEIADCRDPADYPTMSDFVRTAVRRLCREIRRQRVRAEVERLVQDREEMERAVALAEANFPDLAERWAKADRGEL